MNKIAEFMGFLVGEFDNSKQFEELNEKGVKDFPFAEHINTVCNDKIQGLPEDFKGVFIVEESIYTVMGNKRRSSHLFLFTEEKEGILLTSYDLPLEGGKKDFTYGDLKNINYKDLKKSEKFNPALFVKKGDSWVGKSESMFTDKLKFILEESFSEKELRVSETMETNGKRTFGYDEPIVYVRKG